MVSLFLFLFLDTRPLDMSLRTQEAIISQPSALNSTINTTHHVLCFDNRYIHHNHLSLEAATTCEHHGSSKINSRSLFGSCRYCCCTDLQRETDALLQVKYNITEANGMTHDLHLLLTGTEPFCVFEAMRWPGTKTLKVCKTTRCVFPEMSALM